MVVVAVTSEQLESWRQVLVRVDSYMSLVYHRGGISEWDTPATPPRDAWQVAFSRARIASEDIAAVLSAAVEEGK